MDLAMEEKILPEMRRNRVDEEKAEVGKIRKEEEAAEVGKNRAEEEDDEMGKDLAEDEKNPTEQVLSFIPLMQLFSWYLKLTECACDYMLQL
jgi:hypothetical protein